MKYYTLPEGQTGYETPDDHPPDNTPPAASVADLAGEAAGAGANEQDFPDEPTGPGTDPKEETEFERLTHTLDEIMMSYKTELDVVTKTGRNPYKLAEEEMKNSAATEETRKAMIDRLITYLKAKGVNI